MRRALKWIGGILAVPILLPLVLVGLLRQKGGDLLEAYIGLGQSF